MAVDFDADPLQGSIVTRDTTGSDHFVVCLMRKREDAENESIEFIKNFQRIIRQNNGKIQMCSDSNKDWAIVDGQDNIKEPNHLSPAVFDFNAVLIGAFMSAEDVQIWWSSDEVFELLKYRTPIEKMGIYTIEGLQRAYDIEFDHSALPYSERFVFLEFMQLQAFKPVQHYVDCYKRYAERSLEEIGVDCNLLFAEGVRSVFMNEFPLEAACASTWRSKMDASYWYDADLYIKQLLPLRKEYAVSVSLICPLIEDKYSDSLGRRERRNDVLAALRPKKKQTALVIR